MAKKSERLDAIKPFYYYPQLHRWLNLSVYHFGLSNCQHGRPLIVVLVRFDSLNTIGCRLWTVNR